MTQFVKLLHGKHKNLDLDSHNLYKNASWDDPRLLSQGRKVRGRDKDILLSTWSASLASVVGIWAEERVFLKQKVEGT